MNKIFHVDLDGTFLTTDKKIGEATREAVKYFLEKGNYFVINTGRAPVSVMPLFNSLDVGRKNCFLICYNGTLIYDCEHDEAIYRCEVPKDVALEVFDLAKEAGIYIQTYEDDFVICEEENECSAKYAFNSKMDIKAVGNMSKYLTHDVPKLLAIELHEPERIKTFVEKLQGIYGEKYSVMPSSTTFYEFFRKDGGKGNAILRLCEYLDIPVGNSIAAGDQQNDISMLRSAGFSIGVKNAVDSVKEIVDEVTEKDNDHDALAEYFYRFAD